MQLHGRAQHLYIHVDVHGAGLSTARGLLAVAATDRVGLYSADNGWIFDEEGGWSFAGRSPAALWEGLFFPPANSRDEMERLWHQALSRLDGLA